MDQRIPKVEHCDRKAGGGGVLSQNRRALALFSGFSTKTPPELHKPAVSKYVHLDWSTLFNKPKRCHVMYIYMTKKQKFQSRNKK